MTRLSGIFIALPLLDAFGSAILADDPPPGSSSRDDLIVCRNGAVVSVSGPASDVGVDVLKRGGNAVDAAVATAFALAVTYPAAGNIGGGGYMLVVPPAETAQSAVVDFREVAPQAATREMFVRPADRTPHRRVGVPGTVAGLAAAHARFGKRPWKELVEPAVRLAREGFLLDAANAKSFNEILKKSDRKEFASLHRYFGKPGGGAWKNGDRLVQIELADTLERIAEKGADGFYRGDTAALLVAEMERGGGLIARIDLEKYVPKWREPLRGSYRGHTILGVPPSSSGGTVLIEALNILEQFPLSTLGRWSPECLHLMAEASRRAYRDRARYLADPDFTEIPARLTQPDYAAELARGIDPKKATPSASLAGDIVLSQESEETTHFSVIDRDRMAVSLTYTLENSWGSRVVVPGAGFLLNDEMNDFNWRPGVTDEKGAIGTEPNTVAPGKRMLSSMCPTVVLKDDKPLLVTGSPGGRTIINTVLAIIVNVVDFRLELRTAVDAPRHHHQWFPDRLRVEAPLDMLHPDAVKTLRSMGHTVEAGPRQGDAHSIGINPKTGEITAAADRRISGKASGY